MYVYIHWFIWGLRNLSWGRKGNLTVTMLWGLDDINKEKLCGIKLPEKKPQDPIIGGKWWFPAE